MKELKGIYPNLDLEHILGSNKEKLNDLLLAPTPHDIHMKIENGKDVVGFSFEENLVRAIEEILDAYERLYELAINFKNK